MKGSITIKLAYKFREQITKVSVKDTGVGIKEEDVPKLFQRFGKLEQTSKINTSGVGLGLSISKQIVEALDGTIYLKDSSPLGTTFAFTIKCN